MLQKRAKPAIVNVKDSYRNSRYFRNRLS